MYANNGISYTELKNMDLAEFQTAVEAKIMFDDEVRKNSKK